MPPHVAPACAPDIDESGPEVHHRLTLTEPGFLALALDDFDDDVDVHLLSARDSDACIDRGHHNAGSWVDAGECWVIVDSWVDDDGQSQEGAFQLYANLTTATAFESEGLDRDVLSSALTVFANAWAADDTERFEYTIIDFSLPSSDRRQWTLDLADGSLLYSLLVSHGEGSGADDPRYADTFSNTDGSHMSSLGLMRTSYAYDGSNGSSLVLEGLEPEINDNVESRAIVVHGASYATQDFVDDYGYLGRSWGCPAVDEAVIDALIAEVEDGSLYSTWYPTGLENSAYLP